MSNITNTVDTLGALLAQKAELDKQIKALKGQLVEEVAAYGANRFAGVLFDAVVVTAERKLVNWQKIARDLGATNQRIAKNTKVSDTVSVKVTARKDVAA